MNQDAKIIVVLASILVIVAAGIYIIFKVQQEKIEEVAFDYNGFNFRKTAKGYKVEIFINQNKNPSYFTIRSDPRELAKIPVDIDVSALKEKKQVYAVIDPDENLTGVTVMAVLELENVVENQFLYNIPLNSAFIREHPEKKMEVKTCRDANETVAIVWFRLGEATRVAYEGDCIVIEAPVEDDLIKAANRLTLTMLGVIPK